MSDLYHVSSSPHVRAKDSTDRIMLYVIIALLPASLFGIYNFGFRALFIILLTIASCVASEWVFDYIVKKKSTITDLSAVVTGLLLALNLPVSLPWWEAVLGGVFAIIIVKCMFGGLGQNFMNPALGGRCFLLIAFAADMTNFNVTRNGVDVYSGATPLALIKNEGLSSVNVRDMLIGNTAGTIGETSVIAILIGAIIMILLGVIDLKIPASYIITFAVFMFLFGAQQLCCCRALRWRTDARCIFHGDRLCHKPDYADGKDNIRYLLWYIDRSIPLLWCQCRGSFLCYHLKQLPCSYY